MIEKKNFEKEDMDEVLYLDKDKIYKSNETGNEYIGVDPGDWIDDGKYSYRVSIFKFDDKLWEISCGRSGSYFTDYYYDWENLKEIEATRVYPHETITIVYKAEPPNKSE